VVQFFNAAGVTRCSWILLPISRLPGCWILPYAPGGIVADYLRHPEEPVNLTLETMLAAAGGYVAQGQSQAAETYLSAVNGALDALEAEA
jgi:hypothetical protein